MGCCAERPFEESILKSMRPLPYTGSSPGVPRSTVIPFSLVLICSAERVGLSKQSIATAAVT